MTFYSQVTFTVLSTIYDSVSMEIQVSVLQTRGRSLVCTVGIIGAITVITPHFSTLSLTEGLYLEF